MIDEDFKPHPSHKLFNMDGFCMACGHHRERSRGITRECVQYNAHIERPPPSVAPLASIPIDHPKAAEYAAYAKNRYYPKPFWEWLERPSDNPLQRLIDQPGCRKPLHKRRA